MLLVKAHEGFLGAACEQFYFNLSRYPRLSFARPEKKIANTPISWTVGLKFQTSSTPKLYRVPVAQIMITPDHFPPQEILFRSFNAPDKFEQPFNQLDFVLSQNVNKRLSMRLTMRNLLNDKFIVKKGNEITREFKRGRQFNLDVLISF